MKKTRTIPYLCAVLLWLLSSSPLDTQAQFIEASDSLEVNSIFSAPYGFGAGLSLADIDGNGLQDITWCTAEGQTLDIFLQTDSGFIPWLPQGLQSYIEAARSVYWVDYDNDGDKDLFTSFYTWYPGFDFNPGVRLFRNDSFIFTDVTEASGIIPDSGPSYASSWTDFNQDGYLDLHISVRQFGEDQHNRLYRNDGQGGFIDMTSEFGLQDYQGVSFQGLFFDSDGDGDSDLIVANDKTNTINKFYVNQNVDGFIDMSEESGVGINIDGMGVDVADTDGDGDLDVYMTNTGNGGLGEMSGNAYFRNDGGNSFTHEGDYPFGTQVSTFWGCNFQDFDSDGDPDLFAVNQGPTATTSVFMYENLGEGLYVDYPGTAFDSVPGRHFGSAAADMNGDGRMDLAVLDMMEGKNRVWLNTQTAFNWVDVSLTGTVSNRDAIGVWLEVWNGESRQVDFTTCGNSYGGQDGDNHIFGLGEFESVDSLIIRWPSGFTNILYDIPANHHLNIKEDTSSVLIDCVAEIAIINTLAEDNQYSFQADSDLDYISLSWSLEGQILGEEDSLDITFDIPGDYLLCLEVNTGCSSTTVCETISYSCDPPELNPALEMDLLDISLTEEQAFDSVLWSIGDSVLIGSSISFSFDSAGIYEICAIGYHPCGTDSLCQEVSVECPQPEWDISWEQTSDSILLFSEGSIMFDSLVWSSEEETIGTGSIFQWVPDSIGIWTVCGTFYQECGVDSICIEVDNMPSNLAQNQLLEWTAFPIPTDMKLHIESAKRFPSRMNDWTIIDSRGRAIQPSFITYNDDRLILDTSSLSNGKYVLFCPQAGEDSMRIPFFVVH